MTFPFPCRCGKWLQLRPEHAGTLVRCPSCGDTFVAPENLNDIRHDPLPRGGPGDTYALVEEEEPEAPAPPPGPIARRVVVEVGPEETVAHQPRRRRRRARGNRSVLATLFVGFADLAPPSVAYWIAGAMALLGGVLVLAGIVEMRLTTVASGTPQSLTLAQLASGGPGNNVHVKVREFVTGENYVCVVRTGRFAPKVGLGKRGWEKVYVPLLPLTPQIQERRAREPDWHPRAAPGQIRVLLESGRIHKESDLDQLDGQAYVQGTVVNEIRSLDSKARQRLEEAYPGTDFSKCYLLQEGREPGSQARRLFQILGGTLAGCGGVLYALLVFLFTTRKGERRRPTADRP